MTTSTRSGTQGFVLVAVIWVLAGLSLFAALLSGQIEEMQQQSFSMEMEKNSRLDRLAVESGLLYLAATRGHSYAGLRTDRYVPPARGEFDAIDDTVFKALESDLRMDGRAYSVRGDYRLRLQDAGSLVSLRPESLSDLADLLSGSGLSPSEVSRLVDTLLDYTDRDNEPRLNGAERAEYIRMNMLPPTNRFLVDPYQLYNVMGWQEYLEKLPGLFDEVTIYVAGNRNFNTMTSRALTGFDETAETEALRLIERRAETPFQSMAEVQQVTGRLDDYDPLRLTLLPARYLRVRYDRADSSRQWELGITLTPASNLAPWQVDYRLVKNFTEQSNDEDQLGVTPARTIFLR